MLGCASAQRLPGPDLTHSSVLGKGPPHSRGMQGTRRDPPLLPWPDKKQARPVLVGYEEVLLTLRFSWGGKGREANERVTCSHPGAVWIPGPSAESELRAGGAGYVYQSSCV